MMDKETKETILKDITKVIEGCGQSSRRISALKECLPKLQKTLDRAARVSPRAAEMTMATEMFIIVTTPDKSTVYGGTFKEFEKAFVAASKEDRHDYNSDSIWSAVSSNIKNAQEMVPPLLLQAYFEHPDIVKECEAYIKDKGIPVLIALTAEDLFNGLTFLTSVSRDMVHKNILKTLN